MSTAIDKDKIYKTFLLIWVSLVISQVLFAAMVYWIVDGLFPLDMSQPFFGDRAWVVGLAIFFSADALVFSFYRRASMMRESVDKQSLEIVQQALIVSIALSESVTIWGLFLAFGFHYPYFFIWMVVGFVATLLHYPQRQDIDNATLRGAGSELNPETRSL